MKNIVLILVILGCAAAAYFLLPKTDSIDSAQTSLVDGASEVKTLTDTATTENDAMASLISKAPADASVYIVEPSDGATVTSPVTVKFGIENMTVAKAGNNLDNSGHHHLLINLQELPDMSGPLPATDKIVHFGGAQTETQIELAPGEHTLQLLLGNYLHIPHDEPVLSEKITITVE